LPKTEPDKLEPGMCLAKPVLNKGGLVMLAEDTELTAALIEKIKDMDVGGVYVRGLSQPSIPKEEMLAQLDKRFENVETAPYMANLKNLMREHLESLYA
jgi:hypothetical protein